jgi:hypothetical protein
MSSHLYRAFSSRGTNVASRGVSGIYPPHPVQMISFVPGVKIPSTNEKTGEG